MNKMTAIAALTVLASSGSAFAQAFNHDFETPGGYTTSVPEFTDGTGDFWLRTNDAAGDYGSFVNYTGATGSYFAGMDLDGEGAGLPINITFDAFSISGLTDLEFAVDLAEDQDGANEDYDLLDYVDFEYNVDNAGWNKIFSVTGDGVTQFNTEPRVNGVSVTDVFTTFSSALAGVSGSSMQIRVTWFLDSGDEDLAIDNLRVTGVPTPGAVALAGIAGLAGLRRRR